jgi:glycosyltransferase involved in cell wall biosynthesis
MRRRVALISQNWRPNGGVATYLRDLVAALRADGHDTLVIHADSGSGRPAAPGEHLVEHLTQGDTIDRAPIDRALDLLSAFVPTVVHVHANDNFALEAELRRRFATTKTLHTYDFCPTGAKFHYLLDRPCNHRTGVACLPRMVFKRCTYDKRPSVLWRFYRRAAAANRNNAQYATLIVASEWVRRQALATGYPAVQIRTLAYFTSAALDVGPGPSDAPQVLFCGRLVREKGLDLLLRALARLAGPWRLAVAGEGALRPAMTRLAERLGLSDRVRFLGWADRATLSRLYAESAVVAVPSRWPEPFGIVGLEAHAHGRPVVAFAVGGIPEWLDDGASGFLVPPYDIEAFADRLRACLESPTRAAAMGARGRQRVQRDFSPRSHLTRLFDIYDRLPAPGPVSARTAAQIT